MGTIVPDVGEAPCLFCSYANKTGLKSNIMHSPIKIIIQARFIFLCRNVVKTAHLRLLKINMYNVVNISYFLIIASDEMRLSDVFVKN